MSLLRALPRTRHWPRITGLVPFLFACLEAQKQRRVLANLDQAMLRDIGLTREEAREEALRGFWDVPSHWQRSCDADRRISR